MRVRAHGWLYRSIDICATARVRLTGLVYGDQGLFVRRDCFERLGGFPPLRLMEDLFFSRQLRREGRIVIAGSMIGTTMRIKVPSIPDPQVLAASSSDASTLRNAGTSRNTLTARVEVIRCTQTIPHHE